MTASPNPFLPEQLVNELKNQGQSLGLPERSVESITAKVLHAIVIWLEGRELITSADLERIVGRELEKYSPDLAFVYNNRGKII